MKEDLYLESRDSIVVKSNDLIQKSRFKLNLQQQKIILFLVSQIKQTDDDFKEYTFDIREFCRICGLDSIGGTNYETLKTALKELRDKSLYIMIDKNTETLVSWLDHVTFYKDKGLVSVSLDKAMKPYLLHLHENFTKYELIYTLRMKRKATPRLYELLKSYHYNSLKPYTVEFELDRLRTLLDSTKKTYDSFKYFRQFVLAPAIEEINEQTDIKVEMQTISYKRMVNSIRFTIEPQKPVDSFAHAAETDSIFMKKLEAKQNQPKQKKQTEQQPKEKSKAGTELKEETQVQPQEAAEKPAQAAEHQPEPKDLNPAAQDAEPAGKPKRIQVRIYLKGQKDKPIKTFSSYDRTDIDRKAKEWLEENSYPLYSVSSGTSFRWEV